MSLVIVGSVALDSIKTPSGIVEDVLGGSAIYASLAGNNFTDVSIVGVVGEDFPTEHVSLLKERGIDTEGLVTMPGKTFRWKGEYENLNAATTLDTQLNVFADFKPNLSSSYRNSTITLLGNIHPALQLDVLNQIEKCDLIAMDTMNLWINETKELLTEVMKRVDLLFINEDELKLFTGQSNIFLALDDALSLGIKYVVVKRGEYGAIIKDKDNLFFVPVFPVKEVVDPTGAGDSFAGGFTGYLCRENKINFETLKQAALYGTITAANNIKSFSVETLKALSKEEIESMKKELEKWIKL
ncbi:MAG: sugar kinase [Candidatus Cloacimonetes bacterium 4572_65]|nr:MAG: sugar kinase [Candidatus Cloacimonetes bacterium 4572_65]